MPQPIDGTPPSRAHRWAATTLLVLRESFRSFDFNHGLEKAATLSYYGFFSMIPLLLILVFLISSLITASDRAVQVLADTAQGVSPLLSQIILQEVTALSRQRAWSVVSLLVLFWSVTPLTAAIRNAFSAIFKAEHKLKFYQAKLRDAVAVLMLLLLLVLLVASQAASSLVNAGWLPAWPGIYHLVSVLVRVCVAVLCASLFYVALAPIRLNFGVLLFGALLTTVLLGMIGPVFAMVMRFNPDYGYAFGSLKAVFLLFMWVYYSFAAVLWVTEVMANIRRREVLVLKDLFTPGRRRPRQVLLTRFLGRYEAAETVFREGESGREMFCVLDGSIEIRRGGVLLSQVREGGYFGEMAMLIDAPRTATACAGADGATLARISDENFDVVLRENPNVVHALLREMAERLRATDERLHQAPPPAA
jgi:membrane protein